MAELPTAAAPSTKPEVARALAAIEASTLLAEADVAECLTAIGDLIRITGAPETIFDWVLHVLGRESLRQFAAQHHITLHESRATDEEQLPRAAVIWTAGGDGMAIIPQGQRPTTALLQLREEVALRAEELQRAADFQASLRDGHVETVGAWHARTSTAGR
ncbi:hypothetical protein QFZ75_003650 [Streptomyces sp. V3I8]|uniref:hypothetical protein n=1 Tax=Streptomyces sp. V3I8 TaxID=3042279 RepID=UPI00278802D9|nr:hypothetical protein [Streptomyces sp. V3I8]MDQ1037234.1 hypothetical protein [Streptomyces sp. V3I8]